MRGTRERTIGPQTLIPHCGIKGAAKASPRTAAPLATATKTMTTLDEFFDAPSPTNTVVDQVRNLVATIADEHDGCAQVDELVTQWPESALIAALSVNEQDKRKKPPLKAGVIGGQRMIWLTSNGWQQAGYSNRREHAPAATQIRHRTSGRIVDDWIASRVSERAANSVLVATLRGGPLRAFVQEQVSTAWGSVRMGGAQADEAGRLLGGCYPDLLIIESWPPELAARRNDLYPCLVGIDPSSGVWEHELRVAVEIELSPKSDLSGKVRNHDAAMALGWWHCCVWITDDSNVATRLRRSLTTRSGLTPGHYTAHTADVGIDAIGPSTVPTTWGWASTTDPSTAQGTSRP
jgi:hypothetical protein